MVLGTSQYPSIYNIFSLSFLFIEHTCFGAAGCSALVALSENKCRKLRIPLMIISCIWTDYLDYGVGCGMGCLCPILCKEHGDHYCQYCMNGAPETTVMIGSTNNGNPSTEVLTEIVGNPSTQVITENIESTLNYKPTTEIIANPIDSVITEENIPSTDNGNQVTVASKYKI